MRTRLPVNYGHTHARNEINVDPKELNKNLAQAQVPIAILHALVSVVARHTHPHGSGPVACSLALLFLLAWQYCFIVGFVHVDNIL